MEFMTTEYVKAEAAKGEIPAIEMSLKHHVQGRDAPYEDLIQAYISEKFDIDTEFCACCVLFGFDDEGTGACEKCPLNENKGCCNGLWKNLDIAFDDFDGNYSETNYNKVKTAEANICTYIEGVLEKKRAEVKVAEARETACDNCEYDELRGREYPCDKCSKKLHGASEWTPKKPKEDKPVLRHGDYGIGKSGVGGLVVKISNVLRVADKDYVFPCEPAEENSYKPKIVLGNIFSDLTRNAEDLTEFEVGYFSAEIEDGIAIPTDKYVRLKFQGKEWSFDMDNITEIHQKLGQLIATARRKVKQ